jgi:hypothetical protein
VRLEQLPGKIAKTGLNALVLDSVYRFLELVPMHLRLPYAQIWPTLHFDFSGSTPLALYSWPHETSPEALARNVAGLQIVREIRAPTMPIARAYAERNKLEIDWSNPAATVSKLAVITQTPKEFDHSRFRKRRRADQESCCLPREILRMRHRQRLSQARPKSVCESAMFSGRTSLNRIAPKRKIFPIRM